MALNKVKSLKISFEKVDYNFLKEVESELLKNGVRQNSVGIYYRTLRAIYNKAINAKRVGYEHYPFRHYRIKKEKTRPRDISQEEMRAYFNLNLDKTSYLHLGRNQPKEIFNYAQEFYPILNRPINGGLQNHPHI